MKRLLWTLVATLLFAVATGAQGTIVIGASASEMPRYASDPYTCTAVTRSTFYYNTTSETAKICNGTAWGSLGGASVLDDLSDVVITSPASGDVLAHNGSVWVNSYIGITTRKDSGTTITLVTGDKDSAVVGTNAAAKAVGIAQAGASGFPLKWSTTYCTYSAGLSTFQPTTSTIWNGSSYTTSLTLATGDCATIWVSDVSGNGEYSASIKRAVPTRTTGTTNFLREDYTFAAAGGSGVPLPNTRRWAYNVPLPTGGIWSQIGDNVLNEIGTITQPALDATNLRPSIQYETAATTNSDGGSNGVANNYRVGSNLLVQWSVKIEQTTDIRAMFCVTDASITEIPTSDNLSGSIWACLRYSTSVPDTNWQAGTNDGTSTGAFTDTGVAASTSAVKLQIKEQVGSSNWQFCVNSTCVTRSADLPTGNLRVVTVIRTLANAAKDLRVSAIYTEID